MPLLPKKRQNAVNAATHPELDLASLRHEILHCQEQLDQITKRRQPLVIKKRGNYAYFVRIKMMQLEYILIYPLLCILFWAATVLKIILRNTYGSEV